MKKAKKGFTLIELLIVVAILATLAASMMMSFGSSTAAAKAAAIAANVDTCMTAAKIYYAENINTEESSFKMATEIKKKIPNWAKFDDSTTKGTVKYTLEDDQEAPTKWVVLVDFGDAPDKADIADALKKIQGYNDTNDATKIDANKFRVNLLTGAITAGN